MDQAEADNRFVRLVSRFWKEEVPNMATVTAVQEADFSGIRTYEFIDCGDSACGGVCRSHVSTSR
jgi:hypothetical protein